MSQLEWVGLFVTILDNFELDLYKIAQKNRESAIVMEWHCEMADF